MYYNNNDIRIEEMPKPKVGKGELLMRVMASGICGSDVMEWYRIKKAPLVLGHEVSGIIEEVGAGVKGFKKGDRIIATHHVPCYKCHYCQRGKHTVCNTLKTTKFYPGGFAQFLLIPEINVKSGTFHIPKNVSFEEATFVEPLGCVIRGQKIANVQKGETVLVLGSGMSGLLHVQLAKVNGATKVIAADVEEFKLKMAKKLGAHHVINANKNIVEKVKELNNGKLADLVIVSTGAMKAIETALQCVDFGGTILFFAPTEPEKKFEFDFNDFWFKQLTFTTTYAAAKEDLKEALKLIKSGKIKVKEMITHRLPLEKISYGFKLVAEGKESIKVIIEPNKIISRNIHKKYT